MRILFLAMPDSIHAARWMNMVGDEGWDVHFFPVYHAPVHPGFRNLTIHDGLLGYHPDAARKHVRMRGVWPFAWSRAYHKLCIWANGSSQLRAFRAHRLVRLLRTLKPDIVHSLEIQHAGYQVLAAKNLYRGVFPTWIVSNWGSDVYLFGRLAAHTEKVKAVLRNCDFYACECQRDVALARALGFTGGQMPVVPNSGGFDLERVRPLRQPGPTSERRVILLKGYTGWHGRALVGLRALSLVAEHLRGYRIAIYSAREDVQIAAELFAQSTGIPVDLIPRCSHDEMLAWHGRARLSIGLSISDAISTSLLEAMVMGSFPIQSDTSCGTEWIEDGVSGFIVPPEDPAPIAAAIKIALCDHVLVDNAAARNAEMADRRLSAPVIQAEVGAAYRAIFEQTQKTGAKR